MSSAFEYASHEPPAAVSENEAAAAMTRPTDSENNPALTLVHSQEVAVERTLVATTCSVIESPDLINAARKLVTKKYLRLNFVTQDEVVDDIIADDPIHNDATYFAKVNQMSDDTSDIVATLRIAHFNPEKGADSFPVWQHKDELYPDAVAEIEAIGLDHCVEVTALVKDKELDVDGTATLELYRATFQNSLKKAADEERSESVYLMAANPMLFEVFKLNFNGYIKRIGPDLDYPGQEAIPAMIRFRDGTIDALRRMTNEDINNDQLKFVVTYLLDGLDESDVDDGVATALSEARVAGVLPPAKEPEIEPISIEYIDEGDPAADVEAESAYRVTSDLEIEVIVSNQLNNEIDADTNGAAPEVATPDSTMEHVIDTPKDGTIREHLRRRRPEYIAAAGLIGYTVLRTLGVAHEISPDTDVSWQTFLGIEVATTPTYVAGMGDIARSIANPGSYSRNRMVGAGVLAGSSFMAPYAYVLAEGEGMPTSSLAGVIALLGVSAVSVIKRLRNARRNNQE